jgi:hypothetical protein
MVGTVFELHKDLGKNYVPGWIDGWMNYASLLKCKKMNLGT